MRYPVIHRDYETRSECDLKKAGAHAYAAHPSTRIMVAVWIIEWSPREYDPPIVWIGNMDDYRQSPPMPTVIKQLIQAEATVTGHNAAFEAAIDRYHVRQFLPLWSWPKLYQLDCTMARAAVQALPLDLDRLGAALGLRFRKDKAGHWLMLRMCKPRKPTKYEAPGIYWDYDAEKLRRLVLYCIADVYTEIDVSNALRPLQEQERPVWLLDQVMNDRGVQIDRKFVDCAEAMVSRAIARADARMLAVTHGEVQKVAQVNRLLSFCKDHGVEFEHIKKTRRSGEKYEAERADKEALGDLLVRVEADNEEPDWDVDLDAPKVPGLSNAEWQEGDPPSPRAAIEVRLEAGKTSLAKLAKFKTQAPEGRARGNLQYHGAQPGRFAGRGIQLQNLMRAGITEPGGWEQAYRDMCELDDETFELVWGSVFGVVPRMMRGAVIAAPGHQLYFADFANVEARGCVWAAKQTDMVDLFASGGLIYEEMASTIFDMPVEEVTRLHTTKQDIIPRFVGKETILGCGYGMGWRAFRRNCKKKGGVLLPEELCERAVGDWRERNHRVVQFWHDLERAARNAIEQPDKVFACGPFSYRLKGPWLQCRLPSGRLIWYRRPHLAPSAEDLAALPEGDWDAEVPRYRWKIHYWGVNSYTKQWAVESTWGGKLFENVIQGMCADFLRCALLALESARYWPVLSVHDEPISEVPLGFGTVEEYVRIVSEVPSWSPGFPLKAQGGCGLRYAKA